MAEIIEHVEEIVAFVAAVVGFLGGWFGKKQKDKPKK